MSIINQSVKIYLASLQDKYSKALPTQAKQKRTYHQARCYQLAFREDEQQIPYA